LKELVKQGLGKKKDLINPELPTYKGGDENTFPVSSGRSLIKLKDKII
jgi:hypothetical protein